MCSLLLAQAGAEVIKVERPGRGDEMRSYIPKFGTDSVNFALLNQGKRSVAIDLKTANGRDQAISLIGNADILLDQFRPGVMDRLGLGYAAMNALNPQLIYCSITGWGQNGPMANMVAHDLNMQAEAGTLGLTAGTDGTPGLPALLSADIAGGAYPAFMNIMLALRSRDQSGRGCYLDVSMADNLFAFQYWCLGNGFSAGDWPKPATGLTVGGSPRYQIYKTLDGRYLACAPLEQPFWENFLRVLGASELMDDTGRVQQVREAISAIIATETASVWLQRFEKVDACVSLVKTVEEGAASPQFAARGLFEGVLDSADGRQIPSLPTPIDGQFRGPDRGNAPALGEANSELL